MLTPGNLYYDQACLTPKVKPVWLVGALSFLDLTWLEEVCFSTVRLIMHKHEHRCATWTWSLITCVTLPFIIKTTQNKPQKSGQLVIFSVLFSIVPWLRYDVMTDVEEATVLRPGCGQSNVSAGQWGTREEVQCCFRWHRATGLSMRTPLETKFPILEIYVIILSKKRFVHATVWLFATDTAIVLVDWV